MMSNHTHWTKDCEYVYRKILVKSLTDLFPAITTGDALDEKQAIIMPFVYDGAITKGQAITISSPISGALAKVRVALTGDTIRGTALTSGADGESHPCLMHGAVKVQASGAITAGTGIKPTGAGLVSYDSTNVKGSYALQTFADGDVGLIFIH